MSDLARSWSAAVRLVSNIDHLPIIRIWRLRHIMATVGRRGNRPARQQASEATGRRGNGLTSDKCRYAGLEVCRYVYVQCGHDRPII